MGTFIFVHLTSALWVGCDIWFVIPVHKVQLWLLSFYIPSAWLFRQGALPSTSALWSLWERPPVLSSHLSLFFFLFREHYFSPWKICCLSWSIRVCNALSQSERTCPFHCGVISFRVVLHRMCVCWPVLFLLKWAKLHWAHKRALHSPLWEAAVPSGCWPLAKSPASERHSFIPHSFWAWYMRALTSSSSNPPLS